MNKVSLLSITIFVVTFQVCLSQSDQWTCNRSEAIMSFIAKNSTGLFPNYSVDPYSIQDPAFKEAVDLNLLENDLFCGLHYTDESRYQYELRTLTQQQLENLPDFYITHKGKCGVCSTTQDLAVYLETDLTQPVRECGVKYSYSSKENLKCLLDLGFTYPCAQIWLYNTLNTRKECGTVCMISYISNQPFIVDGHLNACLQCDEDKSGPIFKYESGRTRRNSGIESEIDRPDDQIYHMEHCYF